MEVLGWRSDAELVDGVRRGEDFAFGRLFERWFGRVLGVAQDILGDPQAAAEVATDTFHALWYHLDRLEDPEGFGAWAVETSRTFAYQRLSAPENREETTPVPLLTTAPDAAAAVAVALLARGLPSAAGLGQALHGAAGAIGSPFASPFGPAAAGAAGSAPAPAGFAGAAPAGGPAPAGFAGATLPVPPQGPPAGYAAGAPGFVGTPGSGSILGGSVGAAADAATQALPSLGAFGPPDDPSAPRVHRYELPEPGGMLRSPQALAGIAAAVILVVVGAVLLLTRGDGNTTAADAATTTVPPAAPSISEPTSAASTTEATTATTATTASTTSEPSTTSTTEATTTSTTRRATTTTTRATSASTTSTTVTTSTTATTTATTPTTTATTPTTRPTTSSSQATTSSSQVTRTTPTSSSTSSSSSSSSSTVPKPVIDAFTVVLNSDVVCAIGTAQRGYTAAWSASNATSSALTVGKDTPIRVAAGKGSTGFCAVKGTAVQVSVAGPGGGASKSTTTP